MGIMNTLPYITGENKNTNDDAWALGSPFINTHIPANLYYGDLSGTALSGTATATASATITGTSTAFDTELKVGDYVTFSSIANKSFRVLAITSPTSMTIDEAVTVSGDSMEVIDLHFLGCTLKTTVKYELSKSESKCSQQGDSVVDMTVSGYSLEVESELTKAGLERMKTIMQGLQLKYNSTSGLIEGMAWTVPIGQSDLSIAKPLHLVAIRDGKESTAPLDHLQIVKAAPTASSEWTMDGTSQIATKTLFRGYIDPSITTQDGTPVLMKAGVI